MLTFDLFFFCCSCWRLFVYHQCVDNACPKSVGGSETFGKIIWQCVCLERCCCQLGFHLWAALGNFPVRAIQFVGGNKYVRISLSFSFPVLLYCVPVGFGAAAVIFAPFLILMRCVNKDLEKHSKEKNEKKSDVHNSMIVLNVQDGETTPTSAFEQPSQKTHFVQ